MTKHESSKHRGESVRTDFCFQDSIWESSDLLDFTGKKLIQSNTGDI